MSANVAQLGRQPLPIDDTAALLLRRHAGERRRVLADRTVTVIASLAAAGVLFVLGIIVAFVVVNGLPYIDMQFLTKPSEGFDQGGGLAAILGSLEMVPLAGSHHFPVSEVIAKKCVGCTLCELDCPYDAIHVFKKDNDRAAARIERNARYLEELGANKTEKVASPEKPGSADDERAA